MFPNIFGYVGFLVLNLIYCVFIWLPCVLCACWYPQRAEEGIHLLGLKLWMVSHYQMNADNRTWLPLTSEPPLQAL